MTLAVAALVAFVAGGFALRGGAAAGTVGVGLWLFGLGPMFGALEHGGMAVGAAQGVGRLAAEAGLPLIGLGWLLLGRDRELVFRVRGVAFVLLLVVAMIDASGAFAPVAAAFCVVAVAVGAAVARAPLGGLGAALGGLAGLLPLPELWLALAFGLVATIVRHDR